MGKSVSSNTVKEFIRAWIEREKLRPGARLPSLRTLSGECRASLPTVQRAVAMLVSEGVLRSSVGSGTYVAAPSPSSDRLIGLVMPYAEPEGTFPGICCLGIRETLDRADYHLVSLSPKIGTFGAERERYEWELIQQLVRLGVHGLLLDLSSPPGAKIWKQLRELPLPMVLFNNNDDGHSISSVLLDDQQAGRLAAEHFLARGHRKLATLAVNDVGSTSVQHRIDGFREALAAAGCPLTPEHVLSLRNRGNHWTRMLEESDLHLRLAGCTGVFCMNDGVAANLIKHLRGNGIRIPEQISVIGVDDSAICEHLQPPLTSLNQGDRHMGDLVARLMLELLSPDAGREVRQLWVRPSLTVRDSVADLN